MGNESEDDFNKLFEDIDLTSTKLGRTPAARNKLIAKVLAHLDAIDFQLDQIEADVLGDAYEYLIAQFASGAGKKAGEFYTPQQVSRILAKVVTLRKDQIKTAYDPTCGSGSLLLRIAKEAEVGEFFGQELNRTTYNLARMNMILHDVHFSRFDIQQEDTLEQPQHVGMQFDAIVANPPFSAKWKGRDNPLNETDDRYSRYGALAPASKADFAFVQHIIHHMSDNSTAAIVMPHGVLFRSNAEHTIRKYIIDELNYLDAVIGLPSNLFYGTNKEVCILVFKKCREHDENILFIDASEEYDVEAGKNSLSDIHVQNIVDTYDSREGIDRFSSVVDVSTIKENDYFLNIARYVLKPEFEEKIDLKNTSKILSELDLPQQHIEKKIKEFCQKYSIPEPNGQNVPLLESFKRGCVQSIVSGEISLSSANEKGRTWENTPLSKILHEHKLRSTGNEDVYSVSVHKGLVNQIEHLGRSYSAASTDHYNRVQSGDIVYTKSPTGGFPYGIIKQSFVSTDVIVSPLYGVFRPVSKALGYWLNTYFEYTTNTNNHLRPIIQKGVKNTISITNDGFLNSELILPTDEQEIITISKFLSLVEMKINFLKYKPDTALKLQKFLINFLSEEE